MIQMNVSGDDVETMATVLQAQLKRIGMNIKIQVFDYGARRDQIRKGDTTLDFAGDGFFPDPSTTYNQETACEPDPTKRITNWTGYCNKELEQLQTQLETELREPERRALLKKILTIKNRDLPLMPIGFAPRFFALSERARGFETNGEGDFQWSGGGLSRTWLDH